MKIFLSWSGPRSRAVAEMLSDWIKCVLQASQPWVSTRDIDRGALWFTEISEQLKDTSVGLICLTQENKNRPWILFEAGALAKGLSSNRVCTLLIDLEPKDLVDPLAQYNHTFANRESIWALVRTLNNCLDGSKLDERILQQVFETYWPQFERDFKIAVDENPPTKTVASRPADDILAEILENTRSLGVKVRRLENDTPKFSIIGGEYTTHDANTSFAVPEAARRRVGSDLFQQEILKRLPEEVQTKIAEITMQRRAVGYQVFIRSYAPFPDDLKPIVEKAVSRMVRSFTLHWFAD